MNLKLHEDGWLRDPEKNLILWIPPGFRNSLDIKGQLCRVIRGREQRELDLENLSYGEHWIDGWDEWDERDAESDD